MSKHDMGNLELKDFLPEFRLSRRNDKMDVRDL